MAYRDDSDAVHHRAVALQRELDQIQRTLKERDLELERLRKVKRGRPPTIPELRADDLEPLPDQKAPAHSGPIDRRRAVLESAREWLGVLDDRTLVMVGSIIEELAQEVERRDELVERLRPLVEQIASQYQRKK
ncbi:MAG TPA: hypothetical protein VGM39_02130 [Kofleriaceae bacterium]|jgi:hypothetical protein